MLLELDVKRFAVAVNLGKLTIFMVAMAFSIRPININSERAVSTYTSIHWLQFLSKKRKKLLLQQQKKNTRINMMTESML